MAVFFLVLTIILWGAAPIFDKIGLQNTKSVMTATIFRGLIVGMLILLIGIFSGKYKELFSMNSKAMLFFSLSGLCAGVLGVFTFYKFLSISETSKAVPLAATYPLVTALLSVAFLGEQLTVVRIAGTLLIVAGVWLVK
ncbi:MAG: hypothetical protein A2252_00965 [Elusimicrobia bacterium RIFOXYA2_FULL_39_19]|nr:MAG: hypothetical protein A2252_00965 [Elusimicrobia bacterium RIFOXYA2_FULL_39_19]